MWPKSKREFTLNSYQEATGQLTKLSPKKCGIQVVYPPRLQFCISIEFHSEVLTRTVFLLQRLLRQFEQQFFESTCRGRIALAWVGSMDNANIALLYQSRITY